MAKKDQLVSDAELERLTAPGPRAVRALNALTYSSTEDRPDPLAALEPETNRDGYKVREERQKRAVRRDVNPGSVVTDMRESDAARFVAAGAAEFV